MSAKNNLCAVLLFLLQVSNPGLLAPVARKRDSGESDKSTTLSKNDFLEGDMIVDQTVLDVISNGTTATKRSAVTDGVKLWPNGVVPYVISTHLSSFVQSIIHRAIEKLNTSTCIRFIPRTNQYHYVNFINGIGCYSHVGRQYSGQAISLGRGCESVGIAIHEMMHTLGFFHTSSRTDRDAYVTIYDKNIKSGMAHNFKKYYHGQIDHLNSPYDITSIMHLPRNAFSKSPRYLNTIEARASAHIKLGETGKLSSVDKYQINALYKCSFTSSSQGSCLATLGLENHAIPDNSLRASSQHSSLYAASAGRLHQSASKFTHGAWCPKTSYNSWLQIDLGQLVKITAIATQGYEGMMYDEYIPKYDLKYKTSPYSNHWYPYVSSCRAYSGTQGLPGNWDGWSVQYNALTPTLTTRYVRLYPKSWIHRPCLRVELYGCKI